MARFRYSAYNSSGVKLRGVIEATTEADARTQLLADGLLVAELKAEHAAAGQALFISTTLNLHDVEFFTAELSLLLKSGLRIDKGLAILKQNVQKPALRDFIGQVLNKLKQGESLSSILATNPAFNNLYIGLVKIAEETGELESVFQRLAEELKYQIELQDKIKQALVYPAVIFSVCILALVFIFNFVVPNLTSLFHDTQQLPGYTIALMAVSDFIVNYQHLIVVAILVAGFASWQFRQHPLVQNTQKAMRERLPVIAAANLLVERIRFNAALSIMLSSGVAIDKALKLAINTLRTTSLQLELKVATEHVNRGKGLAKSLSETRLYPPYFAALLAIGEESGELEKVFREIAERSRKAFYAWVTRFTTLLEPLLILFMGAIVGSIVVIMMMSISAVTDMSI